MYCSRARHNQAMNATKSLSFRPATAAKLPRAPPSEHLELTAALQWRRVPRRLVRALQSCRSSVTGRPCRGIARVTSCTTPTTLSTDRRASAVRGAALWLGQVAYESYQKTLQNPLRQCRACRLWGWFRRQRRERKTARSGTLNHG